jgi:predicted nucleic acid-binding protein
MIAATAILRDAPLATRNARDFEPFTPLGLRLFDTR